MTYFRKNESGRFEQGHVAPVDLSESRDDFFRAIAEYQIRKHCKQYINTFASLENLTALLFQCAARHPDTRMGDLIPIFIETLEQTRRQSTPPLSKVALPLSDVVEEEASEFIGATQKDIATQGEPE